MSPDPTITLERWIEQTQKLLKLDYEEELEQNRLNCEKYSLKKLEDSGLAVRKLNVTNQRSAFGRQLFQFSVPKLKQDVINLTNVGITNGDIVGISVQNNTKAELSGVVLQVKRLSLEVAFDCNANLKILEQSEYYNLIKLANDVTYRRLKYAVDNLYKCSNKTYLVGLLFGTDPLLEPLSVLPPYSNDIAPAILNNVHDTGEIVWFNSNLNHSQKEAIEFALYQKHLSVIHGPPGTGKTTTLTEVILQLITRGYKVFVCAPSNVAVDNIFKQLLSASQNMSKFKLKNFFNFVRLGHPARVDAQIQNYSLDSLVMKSDSSVVSDLRAELDKLKCATRVSRGEFKDLRQQITLYENKAFKESLKSANVIMSTLTSATLNGQLKYLLDGTDVGSFTFDVVIIDECAQALEPAAWIPLSHAKKCILAGDHQQLPATIISQEAANQGLGVSLIERVVKLFHECPQKVVRMLTVQYRMNHLIMNWPSSFFYDNKLTASDEVTDRRLTPENSTEPLPVIRLIDTTGCDMYELETEDQSLSKGNKYEADIVCLYLQKLVEDGISPSQIGVISPYRLQISMIETRCRQLFADNVCNNLEINSVDAFQGREKEVIILSLVRSNQQGEIGFLIEERRLNVAITRARSHLLVVCDSGTVSKESKALESFMDYCYQHADIVSASEYGDQMEQLEDLKTVVKVIKTDTTSSNNRNKKIDNRNSKASTNKRNQKNTKGKIQKKPTEQSKPTQRPVPVQCSQVENKLNEIKAQLNAFLLDSNEIELKFPISLSAGERRMVHEQCELLGLQHESIGEHPNRQLIVSKMAAIKTP